MKVISFYFILECGGQTYTAAENVSMFAHKIQNDKCLISPELVFYATQLGLLATFSILTTLTVYLIQPQSYQ